MHLATKIQKDLAALCYASSHVVKAATPQKLKRRKITTTTYFHFILDACFHGR